MRDQIFSHDGVDLYVVSKGSGEPVFVIGGPWFGHYYLRQLHDELAQEFRVIAYDPRGSGRSSALTEEEITLGGHLQDLKFLQRALEIEKLNIIGHSMGAHVALFYAVDHPNEMGSMVFLHPGPPFEKEEMEKLHGAFMSGHNEESMQQMEQLSSSPQFKAGDAKTHEEFFKVQYSAFFSDKSLLDNLDFGFTSTTAMYAMDAEERLLEQILGLDPFDKASQITCPTLVVHAENDLIPESFSRHLASTIPDAEFSLLNGLGHFGYLEDIDSFIPTIKEFLVRVVEQD